MISGFRKDIMSHDVGNIDTSASFSVAEKARSLLSEMIQTNPFVRALTEETVSKNKNIFTNASTSSSAQMIRDRSSRQCRRTDKTVDLSYKPSYDPRRRVHVKPYCFRNVAVPSTKSFEKMNERKYKKNNDEKQKALRDIKILERSVSRISDDTETLDTVARKTFVFSQMQSFLFVMLLFFIFVAITLIWYLHRRSVHS